MDTTDTVSAPRRTAHAQRLTSECWIYTPERGLKEVTLYGNGSTLAFSGHRLRRWCVVDDADPGAPFALVYSAEPPSGEVRAQLTRLARERFGHPAGVLDASATS